MGLQEQLEATKEHAATAISMLKALHDNKGWDELPYSLEDLIDEAVDLDIISEEEGEI